MRSIPRILPRGRVAHWSREQIDKLSTLELRALMANAERLNEPEVAAICSELLDARPRGHPPARQRKRAADAPRLVTRNKAFELNGVAVSSRVWSRGGMAGDGAVFLALHADEVRQAGGAMSCLLWAPNADGSRPWSDSSGGKERLQHCRIAAVRGGAKGLLMHGKAGSADRVDAETVLELRIEQSGDEYWGTWSPLNRVVNTFE